ncbi:MAG: hypothetical protein A3B13_00935 [Candidatus Liptonbacteria bacterium RIFCSPLOWO2_01_FULL_45_15]|uniref:Uncharacterized protein n=1 Tax=Candidatus Liptonbacteria bacterium RIFCSPLOWO2_01_FULL_45_15 TaxID=1798649 RepID=A0A1G2CIM8_9BACT|nr:MAG: hypothetical protein A3B13_00935 [Candidatus Liptonbacteria bacterium RIFCSPLOWO2_01_FULL_45_15]
MNAETCTTLDGEIISTEEANHRFMYLQALAQCPPGYVPMMANPFKRRTALTDVGSEPQNSSAKE